MRPPKHRSQISILIVEDVDEMRSLLEHTLKDIEGLRISGVAKNGFEARLETLRRRPDLILLDEILPGEFSSDLLHSFVNDGLPVILITGLVEPPEKIPTGALGRLNKPSWDTLEEDRNRFKKFIFEKMNRQKV